MIDLFNGKEPIKAIYKEENIVNLKKILSDNGVIVINYIINNDNINKELEKIVKITNNYKVITHKKYFDDIKKKGNIIIILSNNEINISDTYEYVDIDNI